MTDDLLNQIRAARQEAEAIATANMNPAAMRQFVAILGKHLAELEAEAEAAQTEARQKSAERAERLKQELSRDFTNVGEYIDVGTGTVALTQKTLDDVIAGRVGCCDDYEMAIVTHREIASINCCKWLAMGLEWGMEAVGATLEVLPEKRRRPGIVTAVETILKGFGKTPADLHKKLELLHEARKEERTATAQAIGADAYNTANQRRIEAESKAGGYITLADVADVIAKEIKPKVTKESLKTMLGAFFKKKKMTPRPAEGDHRQTREYDRLAADPVIKEFCRRYYDEGMIPPDDWQDVKESLTAKTVRKKRP